MTARCVPTAHTPVKTGTLAASSAVRGLGSLSASGKRMSMTRTVACCTVQTARRAFQRPSVSEQVRAALAARPRQCGIKMSMRYQTRLRLALQQCAWQASQVAPRFFRAAAPSFRTSAQRACSSPRRAYCLTNASCGRGAADCRHHRCYSSSRCHCRLRSRRRR